MKKQFGISAFFCAVFLLLGNGTLQAQFSDGILVTEPGLTGRGFHLSSKKAGNPLLREVNEDVVVQVEPGLNTSTTFIIEDGQSDGSGWTADARYFYIRSVASGKYLTIFGTTDNSPVNLDSLYPADGDSQFAQQFELTPAPAGSGWYKLRSRLSNIGPDLVLEVASDGQIVAGTPKIDPAPEQKFAFNLALPDMDNRSFYILGINSAHFVSGSRFDLPNQFARHKKRFDYTALWKIKQAGDGYYYLFNPLTARYLSANGSTEAGDTLYMSSEANDFAKWELDKSGSNFRFRNKASGFLVGTKAQTESERPLFQTSATAVGIEWIVCWFIDEEEARAGEYDRMLDNSAAPNPCGVVYGNNFKRGLAERVGLPADPKWFPLLFETLLDYYDGNEENANRALQNFDLNNAGHRVELALAFRNYLLMDVAKTGNWSPLALEAILHLQGRVQQIRLHAATRMQNALSDFLLSPAFTNGTQQFSNLVESLDADDFVWPDEYDPQSELQVALMADYTIVAKTFNTPNHDLPLTATAGISVLATPGLAVLINMAIASRFPLIRVANATPVNYKNAFPKLIGRIAAKLGAKSTTAAAIVANAGTVVGVLIMAAEILAAEIKEAIELADLVDEVNVKVAERTQPVVFFTTLNGKDLLAKVKLFEDLDFILGAPVEGGFQYNTNDNVSFPPFELYCQNVDVLLSEQGTASISPEQITGGLILPLCGEPIEYELSQSSFTCNDPQSIPVALTARNDVYTTQCQVTVTLKDETKPVAVCPRNVTVSASLANPCRGVVGNINGQFSDNCQVQGTSFRASGVTVIPQTNGVATGQLFNTGESTVVYTATDASGNSGTCAFTVTVVPCAVLEGAVVWSANTGLGVKDVVINVAGDHVDMDVSAADGSYQLIADQGDGITLTPSKSINKFNGVTTADATRIQQHVAGTSPLPGPFLRIAADVNKSNSITTTDAGLIVQALLGSPSANQIWNTSWRFVHAGHVFTKPNAPWNFPETVQLENLTDELTVVNFIGIKLGDVSTPFVDPQQRPQPVVLRADDRPVKAGEQVGIAFAVDGFSDMAAFQMALHFDPTVLSFASIQTPPGGLLADGNFGVAHTEAGELRVALANAEGETLPNGTALFTVYFTALADVEALSNRIGLDEASLPALAYTADLHPQPVQLLWEQAVTATTGVQADAFALSAHPNPAHAQTTLRFYLPQAAELQMRILDASGKLVYNHTGAYPAGMFEKIVLFPTAGVYLVQLTTPFGVKTVRVVLQR
ncbi:MAG: RICIN domain-containing protein [Saprospiraceae bacterium]|nr:RICIN domain-containing protein [Saprospiraceae bacterium]